MYQLSDKYNLQKNLPANFVQGLFENKDRHKLMDNKSGKIFFKS